jgi:hypothetical protein
MGYDMFLKKKIQVLVPIPVLQIRPVMVVGNFGLKPVVNCQLTLAVDHFFPKRNNFKKIVDLVLELGLGSSSRPSISSRTRSGSQFLFQNWVQF